MSAQELGQRMEDIALHRTPWFTDLAALTIIVTAAVLLSLT